MKTIYSHNNCHKGFLRLRHHIRLYTKFVLVMVGDLGNHMLVEEVVGGGEEERPDSMVPRFTQLYGCLVVSL